MADTFIAGSKFYLKLTIGGSPATVVCKTASSISFSNSSTEVRNQCTGDYSARLSGGQKSGTIEFSGDLNKTPTSPNISAWDLAEAVGDVVPAVWGEIESGGEIVQVPVQINMFVCYLFDLCHYTPVQNPGEPAKSNVAENET